MLPNGVYQGEDKQEWFFKEGTYILSETDDKGFILYANDIFCTIAGYTQEELIGQPHNIIRHPDMPRIAFKGLWDDIQTKGFWRGTVKNLRRDNGFYWVDATVLRKIHENGDVTYLSIRRVPNRKIVENCISLYAQLRSKE